MKRDILDAIQWTFNMTRYEAEAYYKRHLKDKELLKNIEDGYRQHCRKTFIKD